LLSHSRPRAILALCAAAFFGLCCGADTLHAQTLTPRRITNTPEASLNLNPSLSGEGRYLVFESTAGVFGAGGSAGVRAIRVDLSGGTSSFAQLAASRAPAAAVSQDASRVAFASTNDPLGSNADGNSELFLFDGGSLRQITDTTPGEASQRTRDGNFQPSISDDGRFIAFASNRDLANQNADGNFEIFIHDSATQAFTQVTNTRGVIGSTDAKISGDGSRVAFINDAAPAGQVASARRDFMLIDIRANPASVIANTARVVVAGVDQLAFTPGRAMSDDGERVIYSAANSAGANQVFLFDGRNNLLRQLTALGRRVADVPLHPTISGDGSRIAFATRRNVNGGNTDASVELYVHDVPTDMTTRVTDAPAAATAEVIAALDDIGVIVAFNFPRALTDSVSSIEFANNAEIYVATIPKRAPFSTDLQVLNAASFGREPATEKAFAPDSIAIVRGARLALTSVEAQRQSDGSFPLTLANTSVTVDGRSAQLFFVSPAQINLHIPADTPPGVAQLVVRNPDGFETRVPVVIAPAAPGIFTRSANGVGEAIALDAAMLRPGPFTVTDAEGGPRRLILFGTGVTLGGDVTVTFDNQTVPVEAVVRSRDLPGLCEIHVALPLRLRDAGSTSIIVRIGDRASNRTTVNISDGGAPPRPSSISLTATANTIPLGATLQIRATVRDALGDEIINAPIAYTSSDTRIVTINQTGLAVASTTQTGTTIITANASADVSATYELKVVARTLVINEILADPPDNAAGDANRDGQRSGSDDEFVEIVNGSDATVDISGWSLRTRPLSGSTETTRHIFAANTVLPVDDGIVIFGGGAFDPNNFIFGGAAVTEASSGTLSLSNAGLTLIVRDADGNLVTQFSYGAAGDDLAGDSVNQSITRAPDVIGAFVRHMLAAGGAAQRFSPGTYVDGSLFVARTGRLTRLDLESAATTVIEGQTTQITARAFDQFNRPFSASAVTFTSSDASILTVDSVTNQSAGVTTASVTGRRIGSVQISVAAIDGAVTLASNTVTLAVAPAPPQVSRVEVTPALATINRGATRLFSATAYDAANRIVSGAFFTWESRSPFVASIDAVGLARGVGVGTTVINVTTDDGRGGMISAETSLSVQLPLSINEILADPPGSAASDLQGDANRDGRCDGSEDEFIEIVNTSDQTVDISGLVISDASQNRHTFADNTGLAAGGSIVVFGGGAPPFDDPAFGGAVVMTASSPSLGLNNADDVVTLKLRVGASDVVIASQAYGGASGTSAVTDQSLTRVPDAGIGQPGGNFFAHSAAPNAANRRFSPGTQIDGAPFNSPTVTRIAITPTAAMIETNAAQTFRARAFGIFNGAEVEMANVSFIWESSNPLTATLSTLTGASTVAAGLAPGISTVRARAGGVEGMASLTVNAPVPPVARITITPTSASVGAGQAQQFNARAFDLSNQELSGVSFAWSSNNTAAATINLTGLAVGIGAGNANITATANGVTSNVATLEVSPPPVVSIDQVIINEAVIGIDSGNAQARDFVELYNVSDRTLDISGLVISFRQSGAGTGVLTIVLPGVVGSRTTLIGPRSYYLIANGAQAYGVTADFDAGMTNAPNGFNLNNTTGGIKIEISGVKLDGLTYQGGSSAPAPVFVTFGEGTLMLFTGGTTNDLIRTPNAADTNDNARDFRRNGTTANITPRATNPTLP